MSGELADLAHRHGADKLQHGYCQWYERHLAPRRDEPLRLLEIGVGGYKDPDEGGQSLRMWRDYLPKATIVGVDLFSKTLDLGDRVTIVRGSQADPDFLRQLHERSGPFDVVVDDGSHVNWHRNLTFEVLFPLLADDGLYVMEDLHTAYLRTFYGGNNRPQAGRTDQASSIELVKSLLDGLNHAYVPHWEPQQFDTSIVAVCVYPKIAFIQKGSNTWELNYVEQGAVAAEAEV